LYRQSKGEERYIGKQALQAQRPASIC